MTLMTALLLFSLISTVSGVAYAFGYAQGERATRKKYRKNPDPRPQTWRFFD